MNINFLPDDIIDYIGNYFLDSIQSKKNLKLCSKHNNSLINISCNFNFIYFPIYRKDLSNLLILGMDSFLHY